MLGGKGANCAVAVTQLGTPVGLLAVAGDDDVGDRLLVRAGRDGVDTRHVVRRPDTATGLVVDASRSGDPRDAGSADRSPVP